VSLRGATFVLLFGVVAGCGNQRSVSQDTLVPLGPTRPVNVRGVTTTTTLATTSTTSPKPIENSSTTTSTEVFFTIDVPTTVTTVPVEVPALPVSTTTTTNPIPPPVPGTTVAEPPTPTTTATTTTTTTTVAPPQTVPPDPTVLEAAFLESVDALKVCGRRPRRCDLAAVALPGSTYYGSIEMLFAERAAKNFRTVSGFGEHRVRIDKTVIEGDAGYTTVCGYDTTVLFDVQDGSNPDDDIVVDDSSRSYRMRWRLELVGGHWGIEHGDLLEERAGSDICGF
jgi:hypothetical protein